MGGWKDGVQPGEPAFGAQSGFGGQGPPPASVQVPGDPRQGPPVQTPGVAIPLPQDPPNQEQPHRELPQPSRDPPNQTQTAISPQIPPEAKPYEGGQVVARVGPEAILYSEVGSGMAEIRAANKDVVPADELEQQIKLLVQKRLQERIEAKLVYVDAKRTIPPEGLRNIEKRIGDEFDKTEVSNMMKRAKVESVRELQDKLQEMGTSLEQQKRLFLEQVIASQWLRQQKKSEAEIPIADVVAYYQEHSPEYEHRARARWEQLMLRFSRFPTKEEAYAAMADLGNQVFAGAPLAEVARAKSDGTTAREGGQRPWTTEGSLVSTVLDRAIFTLPVGQLSPILEDDQGFHIVRVLQREAAGRTSFEEAQGGIREKLRKNRTEREDAAYMAKLWEKTPVWTVFDGQPALVANRPEQQPAR